MVKKKAYSILIVIYTIFNIYILFNYKETVNISNNIDNKIVSDHGEDTMENNTKIDEENNDESKSKENINQGKKENERDSNTESNITEEEKKKRREERVRKYKNDLGPEFEKKFDDNETEVKSSEVEKKESILKVPARDIEKKLTLVEKVKIINICKQLSKEDYSCITRYLNSENEKEAVINTMNLLEDRLDDEEIDEVINIFSKYIDFEKLDKKY